MTPRAAFRLDDLALIELAGEDRLDWLQGQATNDVRALEPGGRASFCFCEPTGQILALLDAWALDDRIVMATAHERVSAVLERVESMTILEDVVARDLPLVGIWSSHAPKGDALVLPFAAYGGDQVWAEEDVIDRLLGEREGVDGEAVRLAAGVPRWGADVGPRTLPAELGPDFEARHVSYAKGCYTGQEILMRMHSRGHTNRTWVGLLAAQPMALGASVVFEGREVGTVSSAAPHPERSDTFIAAATLRNEATPEGTRVTVGDVEAEVRPMPILRDW